MNLCKNCKYFNRGPWGYELCEHPKFMEALADPVNGGNRAYCKILRKYEVKEGGCGVNGDYWEKRITFWGKLWNKLK